MGGEKCLMMLNVPSQHKNSPYEIRAELKPIVKAEMRMLAAAVAERFGDVTKAYICKVPAGIASANISVDLLYIICEGACRS